jgi:FkbM family methyltransferase
MIKRFARSVFPWLPAFRAAIAQGRLREIPALAAEIGLPAALQLWFASHCLRCTQTRRIARLRLPGYRYPLHYRPSVSDPLVIDQVLVRKEYAAVAMLPGIEFIIDCGANIGCATFYLLHHYSRARVVVVEPDPGNMAICRRNLAPFRDRVMFVEAGIWSAAGPLVVDRGSYRDGAAWSFQVRPTRPGEKPDVNAVTIPDLMKLAGFPRIDLLKMDIEGAEEEVFDSAAGAWLGKTRNLVVELHGSACERAVETALTPFSFDRTVAGELTFFGNITEVQPRCS